MALHNHAISLGPRGMRILRFPLVKLIMALLFFGGCLVFAGFIIQLSESFFFDQEPDSMIWETIKVILLSGASLISYWLFRGLVEGEPLSDLSMKHLFSQLGLGILLGAGFISLIILVISIMGGYQVNGTHAFAVLVPVFLMSVQAGIVEEIMSRGIIFRVVEEGLGTFVSLFISAAIFGFLHIWNDNATVFSSISIALTAGVILALLYVLTRQLWIPIGMHFAWNFTLGGIYGAAVSGGDQQGLLNSKFEGPEWLTGGAFGPEASLITVFVFILFGVVLGYIVIKRRLYICPMWVTMREMVKR